MLMTLFGNINIHKGNMTRGSAYVLYENNGELWIGLHDEFKGGMYPGCHYDDMIQELIKLKTYEDFSLAMYKFNKEHHNYSDFKTYHMSLKEYLGHSVENNTIDFSEDIYSHWSGDYNFFVNMTKKKFIFKTKAEVQKKVTIPSMSIITFNFGTLQGVYNTALPDRFLANNNV